MSAQEFLQYDGSSQTWHGTPAALHEEPTYKSDMIIDEIDDGTIVVILASKNTRWHYVMVSEQGSVQLGWMSRTFMNKITQLNPQHHSGQELQ